ncbi:tumor necrosis factor [Pogona vitticeps]
MSSEHLVHDLEKGAAGSIVVVRESDARKEGGPWKCLSICSFLLLIGATVVFALLQSGVFQQFGMQNSKESGHSFSESSLPQTLSVQAVRSGKPAAHAIASLNHRDELVWTTNVAPSVLENGMRLDTSDNSLVVPSSGLYFVYSQVVFHKESCTKPVLLTHTISWLSDQFQSEVELLKSIKTTCEGGKDAEGKSKLWFESIYQGAVFKLHKGDRLWSKTDSLEYLDLTRQGQIYFGVIAM